MLNLDNVTVGSVISCRSMAQGKCCSNAPYLSPEALNCTAPSGIGSWRYPNGSYVHLRLRRDSFGISRHPGRVDLHRLGSHITEGIWRCEVPGINGVNKTLNLGILKSGKGKFTPTLPEAKI